MYRSGGTAFCFELGRPAKIILLEVTLWAPVGPQQETCTMGSGWGDRLLACNLQSLEVCELQPLVTPCCWLSGRIYLLAFSESLGGATGLQQVVSHVEDSECPPVTCER